jgi:hypothetical protein
MQGDNSEDTLSHPSIDSTILFCIERMKVLYSQHRDIVTVGMNNW